MSASTYFVSEAAVRNLKQIAARRVSGVSSAHLSEGIAAALGFKTHASLRAALSGRPTAQARKPSNSLLAERLRQLGYAQVPHDLALLPDLDRSYSPLKSFPLASKRGVRWTAWRNIIVSAINAGIDQGTFGLSPGENWWTISAPNQSEPKRGLFRFKFDDALHGVASVAAISRDELSFHVVLNPRNDAFGPDHFSSLADADAYALCWFERRLGAWIHDGGEDFSCKRAVQTRIATTLIEPNGYSDQGSFIM